MNNVEKAGDDSPMVMRDRCCAICGSPSTQCWMKAHVDMTKLDRFAFASRKLPEYMHFDLALCVSCDLVFAQFVPQADWFQTSYREADFDAGAESQFAAKTYGSEFKRVSHRLKTKTSALDIGAGDGTFLTELLDAGFDQVVGVEPSLEPVSSALPSVKHLIRNDFFRATDFQPASFDLITCFQTLEHLEDPLTMCKSAFQLLRPGGMLMTAAHNFRAPLARVLGQRSPIYDVEHLQLFSPRSMRNLYLNAGFSEIEVLPLRNAYPITYWMKLLPLPDFIKRALLKNFSTAKIGQFIISAKVGNLVATGIKHV